MTRTEADQLLADHELIAAAEGLMDGARELERQLLENDIPSLLQRPPEKACCGDGGCACGMKLQVLVREEDVPKVQQLMHAEWIEAVRREGTLGEDLQLMKLAPPEEGAEPPCPACGHLGALVEGCCGDCGLYLEG